MSGSGKCKGNLNFCINYGAAEKNQEKMIVEFTAAITSFQRKGKIEYPISVKFNFPAKEDSTD